MNFDELSTLMRENGIVGAGGAGFPSYAKLNTSVDTIILNCAECEPLLRLHRQLLEKKTYEILYALDLVSKTIGAKNVIVALKSAYKNAIASLEANLASFPNINICKLKEMYPAGDEVILIHCATGRVVPPGGLPAAVGVIVYNVETMYNLYKATKNEPVTHKYVTVGGEVKHPQTFYAPIGISLGELIDMAGGETTNSPAYLLGGPMMGRLGSRFDVVTKTSNAVIVLPQNHYVVLRKKTSPKIDLKRAMASCCQCRYCTDLCPRHLIGHPIEPHEVMRVASNHDTHSYIPYVNAMYCSSCGLCEMYSCFQGLSPRNLIASIKDGFRKAGIRAPQINPSELPAPNKDIELKRVPLKRLRARMDLEKYNKSAPMVETEINPKSVKIMLSQHVGVPASAIVEKGMKVNAGDLIAKGAEGKLSVNIHTSITGVVSEVSDKFITIKS